MDQAVLTQISTLIGIALGCATLYGIVRVSLQKLVKFLSDSLKEGIQMHKTDAELIERRFISLEQTIKQHDERITRTDEIIDDFKESIKGMIGSLSDQLKEIRSYIIQTHKE